LLVGAATGLPISTTLAAESAGTYPAKSIRWVVPYPAGAANDVITRVVAQRLSVSFKQPIVVDNRGGAGGTIAAETVSRAAPDGYTILLANPGPSVNSPLLQKNINYRIEAFTPVVFLGYTPLIIVAHAGFEARNARELVKYAHANPGKLSWGSVGYGSSVHIGLALFQSITRIEVLHVPYKGSAQALTEILGGQIQVMHTSVASAEAHIQSRRIKVLATAGPKRQAVLPDVQTLSEQGIQGADSTNWFGVVVPASTSSSRVAILNRHVNAALDQSDVRQRLENLGLIVAGGSSNDFSNFLKNETDRIRNLLKQGSLALQD